MQRTAAIVGGLVAVVSAFVVFGPTPPRDYLESIRGGVTKERLTYKSKPKDSTSELANVCEETVEVDGMTPADFRMRLLESSFSELGLYSRQAGFLGCDNGILDYSVTVNKVGPQPKYHISALFVRELEPREVWWLKMTHPGEHLF